MAGFPNPGMIRLVFDRVLPKDIIKDTSVMLSYMGMINTMAHLQVGRAVIQSHPKPIRQVGLYR